VTDAADAAAAADPLFLTFQLALAGRYSIDRELGRGGMGVVYLAREVHLDRLVAIKLLPPDKAADDSLRARFLREARLAAKLSHPNIIPIHAVEERDGFVYFVMSFIDGETLTQRVRGRGPLPTSEGARVLREVAWALAYAHAQGIVHRDVKPDNILLEAGSGRALVADFGIAAVSSDAPTTAGKFSGGAGITSAGGVTGTPEFMSPEQSLGEPLDARSDLYSLGATAFFMFSGRFPFEGRSATEILAKHVTEPAPPLAAQGRSVPRKLAAVVDRCLAKDPSQRPASAQTIAEQLGLALEQRREVPAALRAFVKRARLNGGGTVISGFLLIPASTGVSVFLGTAAGWSAFALGALGGSGAYLVFAARRLLLQGFEQADVAPAYRAEIEQAREELGGVAQTDARAERWLRRLAKASGAIGVASLGLWGVATLTLTAPTYYYVLNWLGPAAGLSLGVAGWSLLGMVAVAGRHRDVDSDVWSKIWMGRIGSAAFAVARKLIGDKPRAIAMTHRATELSLGMAADQLYQSLPKPARDALGDLPAVLKRLQDDAQVLRARHDQIQEALNDAGDAALAIEYADVRATRDTLHVQLSEAVAALETIRLNLLRLHAGSTNIESLTTHLDLAREMSENVERLIAAHGEVDRALQFPRTHAPTPA
jgi:eukaryotic-like serine/threonine-protein kinase